ncbi:ATP-binding protein [Streptomyces sp. NPDC101237]|uniref:ATP-binding protein n=1 Tax=Streptomyces sp. NPDC101237 TaxID=3366139 RepID=UPI003820CB9A
MELASSRPATRVPVAWHGWWLMPLALGGGTAAATFMSPGRPAVAAAGAAATAACAVCVRLLIRSRRRLRLADEAFRTSRTEQTQQWQQHVAGLERKFSVERALFEDRLAEETAAFDARLAEETAAFDARLAEETAAFDARLAGQSAHYETRLAEQARAYEERLGAQTESAAAQLADQAEVWQEQLSHERAAIARLAGEQLPEALRRLRAGAAVDDLLPETEQCARVDKELQADLRRILRTSLIGVEEEFNRSTAAEQAVVSIGNRIHVLTGKLRGRLHEMQGEHGRLPAVARGLMELDQELGPADSLAASIAVLGGSDRPGRQWQEPQRLLSVVRGGIGRIKDFHRVEVRHLPELGVDGGLVDHLTLILAHLLDNAARYSPLTELVVVSGKAVTNGVGIEIQDSGKGLSEEKKREAELILAGTGAGPGIGGISEDATVGLRVVGILARRYGIRVTFADSPWLGTSVVVVVPHKYFGPLPVTRPPARPAAADAPGAQAHGTAAPPEPGEAADTTPGGLPRRRPSRRAGEERTEARPARTEAVAFTAVPSEESFAGLAAFAAAAEAAGDRGPAADQDDPAGAAAPRTGADDAAGPGFAEHRTEESD